MALSPPFGIRTRPSWSLKHHSTVPQTANAPPPSLFLLQRTCWLGGVLDVRKHKRRLQLRIRRGEQVDGQMAERKQRLRQRNWDLAVDRFEMIESIVFGMQVRRCTLPR